MKVRDVMTNPAIRIHRDEPVTVAARTMEHYNIGALPVCGSDGRICGMLTDRDIVLRCLAGERPPERTTVGSIMTGQVLSVSPDADAGEAARLMGARQIRRLPVVENERLCGMVSLGDLATAWEHTGTEAALAQISSPLGGENNPEKHENKC